MPDRFSRTQMILGDKAMQRLKDASVAVFGIGGVGSFTAEALARCGIGKLILVDKDVVDITNINRQLIALGSTIGRAKTDIMKARITDINPNAEVISIKEFYTAENAKYFDLSGVSYIVDAIDTVTSKLDLIEHANRIEIPIISSMGAGNKLDPTQFEVADIYKTSVCPLARVMRRELRVRGINKLKVVYSKENPVCAVNNPKEDRDFFACDEVISRKRTPGSISFVPSVAGLIIASEVVRDINTYYM